MSDRRGGAPFSGAHERCISSTTRTYLMGCPIGSEDAEPPIHAAPMTGRAGRETPAGRCLAETYPLSAGQVRCHNRDGHVFLPQLMPAHLLAPFREAIVATAQRHRGEQRPLAERDTYGKAFLQIFNLWTLHETVRRFVLAPRFAEVAARLLGVEAVRLYHDQALFKEAGGGITPWHQDQHYWPLDTARTITLWMPLVDVDEDMGLMQFMSGAHKLGSIVNQGISDASEALYANHVAEQGLDVSTIPKARAGDASFHAGWTPHRALPNESSTQREVMTVIYFADGARITNPVRPEAEGDRRAWLGSLPPGAPAATRLNPIVWPAAQQPCATRVQENVKRDG